jgi:hypothetical protein
LFDVLGESVQLLVGDKLAVAEEGDPESLIDVQALHDTFFEESTAQHAARGRWL